MDGGHGEVLISERVMGEDPSEQSTFEQRLKIMRKGPSYANLSGAKYLRQKMAFWHVRGTRVTGAECSHGASGRKQGLGPVMMSLESRCEDYSLYDVGGHWRGLNRVMLQFSLYSKRSI